MFRKSKVAFDYRRVAHRHRMAERRAAQNGRVPDPDRPQPKKAARVKTKVGKLLLARAVERRIRRKKTALKNAEAQRRGMSGL